MHRFPLQATCQGNDGGTETPAGDEVTSL